MFFKGGSWLWLYIRTSIILGSELNSPAPHGQNNCYQLNRFQCSFEEAQHYCHVQRGFLAHIWNKEVQDLIRDYLEEGKKWWIGQNVMPLKKHQDNKYPDVAANGPPKPLSCTYLSRNFIRISSKGDKCLLKYYFICQTGDFLDGDAHYERNGNNSHLYQRHKKTKRGVAIARDKMPPGPGHLPTTCHYPLPAHLSKTLCHPISQFPSVLSSITSQVTSAASEPSSQPLPVITQLTMPVSVTHAGQSLAETTSSPKEEGHPNTFTSYLQVSLQKASGQVIDEIAGNFSRAVHGLQALNKLQEACEFLQKLTALTPRFSKPAQVNLINSLIYLSEELLRIPFQNNNSLGFKVPPTVCPFHSLNNVTKAGEGSWLESKRHTEPVEDILEMSLVEFGNIGEAFLEQNQSPESSVTLTSANATLLLSRQNISTLPLSSYTLGHPAPVRLGFPSALALKELLNKHPGVNVQITGLAFNPFKDLDNRNIVGSIGSVLLSANRKLLQVHDLMEDIEIMLWRNVSLETHPTSLNMSTHQLTITVNVTSLEKSLIVSIDPDSPLLMTLYLGFQYQPNCTHFHLNITLPKDKVWQKDEEYTWVLNPEHLQHGIGTYYITAVLSERQEGAQQTPSLVSVITAVTQCYYWEIHNQTWSSAGCQVGPQSTILRTQCLCNHLTFFASDFFVVPRTVNVEDTIKLFLRVTNNPVGVSLLASLLGFYVITVVWARKKDQADMQKVKVTVLADNDPSAQFHYLIQVYTGYRRSAATTAKVVITLYGSEGRSEPHHLCDPQKTVFERGGLDVFLLTTWTSLGNLHSLRLWHDNSGVSPSWYVSQVIVCDMAVKRKWHFLCNCWLAVDLGDCELDRVFIPVSKRELFSFRHLFSSMIVEKFTQDYLWLSIATRHPWNQFTRVQRLSCCMTLLLCNMVINVMFWKINSTTAKRDEQMRPFAVAWSELLVSIHTAVILFPINLVIGRLFPLIEPQETLPLFPPIQASCLSDASVEPLSATMVVEELKETVRFLLRRNTYLLSKCEQPPWSSWDITKLVKLLSSLVSSHLEGQGCHQQGERHWARVVPENHHHFCCYLHRVLQRLKSHLGTLGLTQGHQSCDFLDAASQLQKLQELLETHILPTEQEPSREVTSFAILSSEEGKKPISNGLSKWLTSVCWLLLGFTSLASAFFTALYSLELSKDQATSWMISIILSVLQNIFISQPVKVVFFTFLYSLMMSRMPRLNKENEQQTKRILALLAKCSSSVPGSRDKNNPVYVAPAINSPTKHPERTLKKKKLFKLTGDILVQILFLTLLMTAIYSAKNSNRFYLHQAIWKTFSHQFSEIKLLQDFYPWANHILLPSLYGDYRGKNAVLEPSHCKCGVQLIFQIPRTKTYEKVDEGQLAFCDNGHTCGRPKSLFPGLHLRRFSYICSPRPMVLIPTDELHERLTSKNENGFSYIMRGAFFTSLRLESFTSLQMSKKGCVWSIISQVIYYLLVCYYAFIQGCQLKQQKWRFFTGKRNILDTSIILISFILLGLDMKSISLHKKNMARYRDDQDRFISFYEAVKVNSAATHLVGFPVLLATVQLWNLLRHSPRLRVISRTLSRAWDEVVGFLLIILILLTGYAIAFNLLFGCSISDYRTFFSSAVTVVGLLMGISHQEEVFALDPVLGTFLILTSVILMVLVVINLFVSAILMAFGKERKSLKKEAALIDTLLQKLSNLLGISWPQKTSSEQAATTAVGSDTEVLDELP
ncbi:polycystin-1-like protein 3 isoform X1 [Homo sapiens]|uniref:polycystin-1-like protein 3 isoform X1 n=1 Tax=Homo sapiens TaxID=9606 RepID=UPI000D0C8F75|nr:polycystin-1-like protein 3 isoform X1 [Homo sapiens]|eukprot:XP_024306022.1 polycystic kidney disease protein 1-like 3 isoform X1 [Homo sapiens]